MITGGASSLPAVNRLQTGLHPGQVDGLFQTTHAHLETNSFSGQMSLMVKTINPETSLSNPEGILFKADRDKAISNQK